MQPDISTDKSMDTFLDKCLCHTVTKANTPAWVKLQMKFESVLAARMLPVYNKSARKAVKQASNMIKAGKTANQIIKATKKQMTGIYTKTDQKKLSRTIKTYYAADRSLSANEFKIDVSDDIDGVVLKGLSRITKETPEIEVAFDLEDKRIAELIESQNLIAAQNLYVNGFSAHVVSVIRNIVSQTGLSLTAQSKLIQIEMARAIGLKEGVSGLDDIKPPNYNGTSKDYYVGLAQTTLTRAQSMGRLNLFAQGDFKKFMYQAIVDKRTSVICLSLNGRIFTVEQGQKHIEKMMSAKSSDELKKVAGWRRDLSEFGVTTPDEFKTGPRSDEISKAIADAGGLIPPAHFRCFDKETEVYTEDGFVLFKEVKIGDKCLSLNPETKDLEWVPVIETQQYHHKGDMYKFTNHQNSLNMLVTPDHTMFHYKRVDHGKAGKTLEPLFSDIDDFCKYKAEAKLYTSSEWVGATPNIVNINGLELSPEHFCEFMGYYLSDGCPRKTSKNTCYIAIAQEIGQDKMFNRLITMGFKNVTKTKGKINIYDSRIGEYCRQFGHSHEKFIPADIKKMDRHQIRIFLDAFVSCDGTTIEQDNDFKDINFNPFKKYFTSSKRMADDIGELLIKSGKSCSYLLDECKGREQKFKNGTYTINHNVWVIFEINSKHRIAKVVEIEHYDDMVYDLSLERNHTLLTRRCGKVIWGSNCRSTIRPIE